MKVKLLLKLTILFLLSSTALKSQDTPSSEKKSLAELNFIIGNWEGTGWQMTREGKVYSDIYEKAECKLDCHVIALDGLGLKTDTLTNESIVVHEAFGVIFLNPETQSIYVRAYKKNDFVETPIEFLGEKIIRWNLQTPRGLVRFTLDFSEENKWKEIGEINRGGEKWMKFMEMELSKIME